MIETTLSDEGPQPRCAQPDVDPEWWIDPDLEILERQRHFGGQVISHRTAYGQAVMQARENQLRAKLYCYECPLLAACKTWGENEPAHVWGGETALERTQRRRFGHTLRGPKIVRKDHAVKPGKSLIRRRIMESFRLGASVTEIAQHLNRAEGSVRNHIYMDLADIRGNLLESRQG